MKAKLILLLSAFFFLAAFNGHAQAEVQDPLFNAKAEFTGETGKFLDASEGLTLDKSSTKTLLKMSPAEAKKLKLPAPTKVGSGPIVLKFGNRCYKFACGKSRSGECDNCRMVWWDRNKDGKVQPRRELRCFCPKTRERCRIGVRVVKCKG